jgi:hypothetical protein
MSNEREQLISEYSEVCKEIRVIQKKWGGEWTNEFRKLRRKAKAIEKRIRELESLANSNDA